MTYQGPCAGPSDITLKKQHRRQLCAIQGADDRRPLGLNLSQRISNDLVKDRFLLKASASTGPMRHDPSGVQLREVGRQGGRHWLDLLNLLLK